jgi:hypothetical protein
MKRIACVLMALWVGVVLAQESLVRQPVKLMVRAQRVVVSLADQIEFTISLLDANNRHVPAPRDLDIEVQVSGTPQRLNLRIPAGTNAVTHQVAAAVPGKASVQARHRNLLSGEAVVLVRPLVTNPLPELVLWQTPGNRRLLADGRDAARIEAVLNQPAPADLSLRFQDSTGHVQPRQPILIPRGQTSASFELATSRVGTVAVQYVGANLPLDCREGSQLHMVFAPPVVRMKASVTPERFTCAQQVRLRVQLVNGDGDPVTTDEPRVLQVSIAQGAGKLAGPSMVVPAGEGVAQMWIYPQSSGPMTVTVRSAGMNDAAVDALVNWPVGQVYGAVLGAVAGVGSWWLARRRHPRTGRHGSLAMAEAGWLALAALAGVACYGLVFVLFRAAHTGLNWLPAVDYAGSAPVAFVAAAVVSRLASRWLGRATD